MREFALIGYPLSHSFSQAYFIEKFRREGITDAVFHSFPIPDLTALPQLLQDLPLLQGFAVTIPYKSSVIAYLN